MTLSRSVKMLGRKFGVEFKRYTVVSDQFEMLVDLAGKNQVDTVLDVGANIGQFAQHFFLSGWTGRILSFEPLSAAHAQLVTAAVSYVDWTVAPRAALGAETGSATIQIAANSQSSSLLPMLGRHKDAAPHALFVGSESVDIMTLTDAIANEKANHRYLLKLDVQGFEMEVLRGAASVLDQCPIIYCEMSLQPLYDGEPLFFMLGQALIDLGYRCAGLFPGFFDAQAREVLQVDGIFIRN